MHFSKKALHLRAKFVSIVHEKLNKILINGEVEVAKFTING